MATTLYINPDPVAGPQRATLLGCGWMPAVPPQYASLVAAPPVVILSGQGVTDIISDQPPTSPAAVAAALTPILALEATAAAAQATLAANQATITARVLANQATINTFIANNPTGAVLTAAQTLVLAKMLSGLCSLLLQEFSWTSGS